MLENIFKTKKVKIKTIKYSDGKVYEGEISSGQPHGQGVLIFNDNKKYKGNFSNGVRTGYGALYENNKKIYQGSWADNKMNGPGTYFFKDGEVVEGFFKDGKLHGDAINYLLNGKVYKTNYNNGEIAQKDLIEDRSNEIEKKEETLDDLLEELNSFIGLSEVKKNVTTLINLHRIQKIRKEAGLKIAPMTLHLVFTGNPGTGKTSMARLIAKIYKNIGLLKEGTFIEVDRSDLVAPYIGQTSINVAKKVKEALGGVLFIDEAYALYNTSRNDFGHEAIDTLIKLMEDHRDNLVVIVAGYEKEMYQFLNSNPGLKSRFKEYISFSDYTAEELMDIFMLFINKNQFTIDGSSKKVLLDLFKIKVANKENNFSNGRLARNIFEDILRVQANRLTEEDSFSDIEKIQQITIEDVKIVNEDYLLSSKS